MAVRRHQPGQQTHGLLAAIQASQRFLQRTQLDIEVGLPFRRAALRRIAQYAAHAMPVGGSRLSQRVHQTLAGAIADLAPLRALPAGSDPVVNHLLLISRKHTEHFCPLALQQAPEPAVLRILAPADPVAFHQRVEKGGNLRRVGQPIVDRASGDAAIIRMRFLADHALCRKNCDDLTLDVELFDDRIGSGAQHVELVAARNPRHETLPVSHPRHALHEPVQGLAGMAGVGIVDRHMEREVSRIDAQFIELVRADQQVQRQLFVPQVESDDLRQKIAGVARQRELNDALNIMVLAQVLPALAAVTCQQPLVDQHMVLVGYAIAQFLEVDPDQRREPGIVPVRHQAIQPGAVHQLGRRDRLQKIQRMRLAGKIAAPGALPASLQVVTVLLADRSGVVGDPVGNVSDVHRQVRLQRVGRRQLLTQVGVCALQRLRARLIAHQVAVQPPQRKG